MHITFRYSTLEHGFFLNRKCLVTHEVLFASLASWGTQRPQTVSCKSSCTYTDQMLTPNMWIRRCYFIKTFIFWMCSSVRNIDGRADRISFVTVVIPSIRWWISTCLKSHQGALFFDGAIVELSVHTFDLVAPCHIPEGWNAGRWLATGHPMCTYGFFLLFFFLRNIEITFDFWFSLVSSLRNSFLLLFRTNYLY